MVCNYSELVTKTKNWAQQAVANHWLDATQVAGLLDADLRSPDSLFSNTDLTGFKKQEGLSRPLVVAFMGGTGVGKSSLLNRLAAQAIAKAGIERPTSREVTLYHHESVAIQQLPENFPLQKIKIAAHQNSAQKNIIWIDMPDFDSTEQSNKSLVLQWLPHIDVLIYVVSPERYRDGKAWRLLLAEGAKHGWLFVLNQWDKGQIAQYEDFKQQLSKAGFEKPLIFRTICTADLPGFKNLEGFNSTISPENDSDEFTLLLSTLNSLATAHGVQQLEQRNLQVRKNQLKQHLQQCLLELDHLANFAELFKHWQQQWSITEKTFKQGFAWNLQQFANRYARSNTDVMVKNQPLFLWDDWAQSRFNDALNNLTASAQQLEIPAAPLKARLAGLQQKLPESLHNQTELECRLALTQPGNALQRGVLKLAAVCEVLLPLVALSWVAYQVFHGYYQSSVGTRAYLGVDFVAHSSLLVIVSWLLPYFISKKMQPALEKTALRGLNKGLDLALLTVEEEVKQVIIAHQTQQQQLVTQLQDYIKACDVNPDSTIIAEDSILANILLN